MDLVCMCAHCYPGARGHTCKLRGINTFPARWKYLLHPDTNIISDRSLGYLNLHTSINDFWGDESIHKYWFSKFKFRESLSFY